jgi:peptidoglycan/LPS O-acetylase OafA/YrhL
MVETTGVVRERPPRYALLDYLRLVAALMVVGLHWLVNGIENGKVTSIGPNDWADPWASYGYLGVSLFFLISGFVISNSARGKTARQFAVGRFVRLYPAFWIALTITTVVIVVAGGDTFTVTVPEFLANLTMAPTYFGQGFVDGAYWTLVYELRFYALVGILLFFGLGRRLDVFFPLWGVVMVLCQLLAPEATADLPFTGGFYLLFAAGALIAIVRDRGPAWWSVLPLLGVWAMSVRFAIDKAIVLDERRPIELNPVVAGGLVTLFYLAVLSMCIPRVAHLRLPLAQPLGALTYPVYLLHAHVGYILLDHLATDATKWLVYPLLLAALIAVAWCLHWLVDLDPRRARIQGVVDRTLGALVDRVQPARFRRDPLRPTPATTPRQRWLRSDTK